MTIIADGQGNGYNAGVTSGNRVKVSSYSVPFQHVHSNDGEAFQVSSTTQAISGTNTAIIMKNDNEDKSIVLTFVRHQVITGSGGTAFPNESSFFFMAFDTEYSGSGEVSVPTNMNTSFSKESGASVYSQNPIIVKSAGGLADFSDRSIFDRWYTKDFGDMSAMTKQGALIVGPGGSLELGYQTDMASATVYVRASFFLSDNSS